MAHFTHFEAEQARAEVIRDYPQLRVSEILDITNEKTGEFERSFFSIGKRPEYPFMAHIASLEEYGAFLYICEYVAQVRGELRQEEYPPSPNVDADYPPRRFSIY